MKLRDKLLPQLRWQIGDGRDCQALGEPWVAGTVLVKPSNLSQRKITVSDLVSQGANQWNTTMLAQLFGGQLASQIEQQIMLPLNSDMKDALVFAGSANGNFCLCML